MKEFLWELLRRFGGLPPEFWDRGASIGGTLVTVLLLRPKTIYDILSTSIIGFVVSEYGHTKAMKIFDLDIRTARLFMGIAGVAIAKAVTNYFLNKEKKGEDITENPFK